MRNFYHLHITAFWEFNFRDFSSSCTRKFQFWFKINLISLQFEQKFAIIKFWKSVSWSFRFTFWVNDAFKNFTEVFVQFLMLLSVLITLSPFYFFTCSSKVSFFNFPPHFYRTNDNDSFMRAEFALFYFKVWTSNSESSAVIMRMSYF